MTFEIKIQNMRQFSTWLCSVTIVQILQIIRRKSSAKRKFTGSTAHFIEKRVYSQRHTREGKTFILAKTRRESRRPVNPIITMRETPFSSSIASIKLSPEQMSHSSSLNPLQWMTLQFLSDNRECPQSNFD